MERLTKRDDFGNPFFKKCFKEPCLGMGCSNPDSCGYMIEVCERLAAYEDTGLEPEEIRAKEKGVQRLGEAIWEDRVILLPRKGQTLWYIAKVDCDCCPHSEECESMDRYTMECKTCPGYVDSEPWSDGDKIDMDQLMDWIEGEYFLTREEAEAAKLKATLAAVE